MRKNKFTNVLIIEDKINQKTVVNTSSHKRTLNWNIHHNKIYFPINDQDKLLPYKLSQKLDSQTKFNYKRNANDENKEKIKPRRTD